MNIDAFRPRLHEGAPCRPCSVKVLRRSWRLASMAGALLAVAVTAPASALCREAVISACDFSTAASPADDEHEGRALPGRWTGGADESPWTVERKPRYGSRGNGQDWRAVPQESVPAEGTTAEIAVKVETPLF